MSDTRPEDPAGDEGLGGEELSAERSAADADALERGELPSEARRRLGEAAAGGSPWTSDLSVAELTAIRGIGFEPVGLVMGTSVYHLGSQWGYRAGGQNLWSTYAGSWQRSYPCPHPFYHDDQRTGYNWEHKVWEDGIRTARDLAHDRLMAEVQALGAHGVAGVRLQVAGLPDVAGVIELQMVGTALKRPGRAAPPVPFTSHLSGQDLAKLVRAGLAPVRLVMSIAAVEADPGCGTEMRLGSWSNVELTQFADAAQGVRELVLDHLHEQARGAADAIVGAEVTYRVHELMGEARLFDLRVVGTAVRRFRPPEAGSEPLAILRLSDPVVAR